MAYITTRLGMKIPDPNTVQAFETSQVNANLLTLEEGLGVRHFTWANVAEQTAQTGMVDGDEAYRRDNGTTYRRIAGSWVLWRRAITNFTPTFTALTLGVGGTAVGSYLISDGLITYQVLATLGSSGFVVGDVHINPLPISLGTVLSAFMIGGGVSYVDASSSQRFFGTAWATGVDARLMRLDSAGTGAQLPLGMTAPFTWAAGDQIAATFSGSVI